MASPRGNLSGTGGPVSESLVLVNFRLTVSDAASVVSYRQRRGWEPRLRNTRIGQRPSGPIGAMANEPPPELPAENERPRLFTRSQARIKRFLRRHHESWNPKPLDGATCRKPGAKSIPGWRGAVGCFFNRRPDYSCRTLGWAGSCFTGLWS